MVRDFAMFAAFYVILKAIIFVIHLELKRAHVHTGAAVSGILT